MILDKVKNTIKRYNLIGKGDKIVVGVSGGPDSLVLLYLLNSLKKELNLSLHIAHLDHKLRKDSYKDRVFVEKLARKLEIPMTTAEINIRQSALRGSLEEIARNARLGFFFRVAKNTKANKIALGHNLDDQAETVLMRILRGTGLYGLSAILPKRKISGYEIIRPLIEIRRRDIEAYLKRKKISPRIDLSNLEDIYFRNKIRNRLLPLLEREYNKNIKEVLSNMAQSIGYDYDYLNRVVKRTIKQVNPAPRPKGRGFGFTRCGVKTKLKLNKLAKLHPAIKRLLFRLCIAKIKGDTRRITFQHIREIEDLLLNRPVNSIVDLPKGVSVAKTKIYLSFYRKANP